MHVSDGLPEKAIAIYAGHPCYNYNEYTLVEKRATTKQVTRINNQYHLADGA